MHRYRKIAFKKTTSCRIYFGIPHASKYQTGQQQASRILGRREYPVGCRNKSAGLPFFDFHYCHEID
jgi:hypothetical protein